jgi:glutaredoxin 3
MAKSFLDANKIAYRDLNVAEDATARDEMITISGKMAVPVISVDGELVIGFDERLLKEKLGIGE